MSCLSIISFSLIYCINILTFCFFCLVKNSILNAVLVCTITVLSNWKSWFVKDTWKLKNYFVFQELINIWIYLMLEKVRWYWSFICCMLSTKFSIVLYIRCYCNTTYVWRILLLIWKLLKWKLNLENVHVHVQICSVPCPKRMVQIWRLQNPTVKQNGLWRQFHKTILWLIW